MQVHRIKDWQMALPLEVTVTDGVITRIAMIADGDYPTLFPKFFDVQINGALGVDFSSGRVTGDDLCKVVTHLKSKSIGGFLATVITGDSETIRGSFASMTAAITADAELNRFIPGFHLEGPYISPDEGPRGAHPVQHIRNPDWDEFQKWQDAAGGRIRLVTLAPERPGAIAFIGKLTAAGIVVAIGHTAADATTIKEAVQAGARFSTHLGNGSHAMLPRHDNYIWEQLANDDLGASIIADGFHLPDAVVKTILRTKTPSRLILTCDASPLAGLPPGEYEHWGQKIVIAENGRIGVAGTPFLAGSGSFTNDCFEAMITRFGVSWKDAVRMASVNPRQWLGLAVPELGIGAFWNEFATWPLASVEA